MPVYALIITGTGGLCLADAPSRAIDRFFFYAGGLLVQLVLFAVSAGVLVMFGSPQSAVVNCYLMTFTVFNALLFIGNLIPFRANDGAMLVRTVRDMHHEA